MSKIFAINAGSSSLKFQVLLMPEKEILAKGMVERIGEEQTIFRMDRAGYKVKKILSGKTYRQAVEYLLDRLLQDKVLHSLSEIAGVGHRVAHGGAHFKASALVTASVLETIERLAFLAPSHNPVNLEVIKVFLELLPAVPNVAVFDTAFHQTMSPEHYLYPLPKIYYERYGLRKYGFHGTSHQYIAKRTQEVFEQAGLSSQDLRIISCHLGNGASLCAIHNQESVNTSMGFTPLAGLMMGSRSGDIDPAIIPFLMEQEQLSPRDINELLNKQSGLLAISELSNDLRDILAAYERRSSKAALAIKLFVNRIAYTIAQYLLDLERVDAIVFTAGIGEHASLIRRKVAEKLRPLGVRLDDAANEAAAVFINQDDSTIKLMVLPTNEELMIATDTFAIVSRLEST